MFRVGQKVVCVNDASIGHGSFFVNAYGKLMRSDGNMGGLTRGNIYTVRRITATEYQTLLALEEIDRPCAGPDPGFRADRFRPLIERKTDISIFTKMLTESKVPVTSGQRT